MTDQPKQPENRFHGGVSPAASFTPTSQILTSKLSFDISTPQRSPYPTTAAEALLQIPVQALLQELPLVVEEESVIENEELTSSRKEIGNKKSDYLKPPFVLKQPPFKRHWSKSHENLALPSKAKLYRVESISETNLHKKC